MWPGRVWEGVRPQVRRVRTPARDSDIRLAAEVRQGTRVPNTARLCGTAESWCPYQLHTITRMRMTAGHTRVDPRVRGPVTPHPSSLRSPAAGRRPRPPYLLLDSPRYECRAHDQQQVGHHAAQQRQLHHTQEGLPLRRGAAAGLGQREGCQGWGGGTADEKGLWDREGRCITALVACVAGISAGQRVTRRGVRRSGTTWGMEMKVASKTDAGQPRGSGVAWTGAEGAQGVSSEGTAHCPKIAWPVIAMRPGTVHSCRCTNQLPP